MGAKFLAHHGRDADGNWYLRFAGNPLVQPWPFSPTALLPWHSNVHWLQAKLTADVAMHAYNNVLRRKENPK